MSITLTPAYGRDYSNATDAITDYLDGKDFIYHDVTTKDKGKYCSCRDLHNQRIKIRYNKNQDVTFTTFYK